MFSYLSYRVSSWIPSLTLVHSLHIAAVNLYLLFFFNTRHFLFLIHRCFTILFAFATLLLLHFFSFQRFLANLDATFALEPPLHCYIFHIFTHQFQDLVLCYSFVSFFPYPSFLNSPSLSFFSFKPFQCRLLPSIQTSL